ncbi:MAG: ATP-binding cassette domain-containing protein [Candidatus Competibacterales bacterium]
MELLSPSTLVPTSLTPPPAEDDLPAIAAKGLVKRYGAFVAVAGVDVQVTRGECWGLLGPNGAGKTTFLRMVTGHAPPSSGELTVLGYPIPGRARAMRQRIGIVPQHDNLDPDFTVEENLKTYGSYFGLSPRSTGQRIDELLAFAALEAKRFDPIGTLSGGMRRRLALIRALINAPELLILDEPTTGLDPQARQRVWQQLRTLNNRGMTLVLTTHYMEEAERLCDRITVLDHGRILASDTPSGLVARHVAPQVVEIHGQGLAQWHRETGSAKALRVEFVGETGFYYTDAPESLVGAATAAGLSYLQRSGNLEDVFITLTGRDLRED